MGNASPVVPVNMPCRKKKGRTERSMADYVSCLIHPYSPFIATLHLCSSPGNLHLAAQLPMKKKVIQKIMLLPVCIIYDGDISLCISVPELKIST